MKKLLSVLLSIALLLSTICALPNVAAETGGETSENVHNYYVQSPGYAVLNGLQTLVYEPDGSRGKPFQCVNDAIKAAITAGYGAGEIVNFYIMQREDWTVYPDDYNFNVATDAKAKVYHNITSYFHGSKTYNGGLSSQIFEFDAVIQADPEGTAETTYLTVVDKLGGNVQLSLGGNTKFYNITLVDQTSQKFPIYAGGNEMTFDKVNFGYTNVYSFGTWNETISIFNTLPISNWRGGSSDTSAGSSDTVTNINILGNDTSSYTIYPLRFHAGGSKSINILDNNILNINNPNATVEIKWGTGATKAPATADSFNVKIDTINSISNKNGTGTITLTEGLQVINNTDKAFDTSSATNLTVTGKIYNLNNITGDAEAIDFYTDETTGNIVVGKYKVKDGITVEAKIGDSTKAMSSGGVLDLTELDAGTYDISIYEEPVIETKEYWVQSPGYEALTSGNLPENPDGSKENPFANVKDAIIYINGLEKYGEGDEITLNIMQRADWKAYNGTVIGKTTDSTAEHTSVNGSTYYNTPYHSMTSWTTASNYNDADFTKSFAYNLIIKPAKNEDGAIDNADNGKVYLAYADQLGGNYAMNIRGNVTFQGITIVTMRDDAIRPIYINDNKVLFDENCSFGHDGVDYYDNITSNKTFSGITALNALQLSLTSGAGSYTGADITFNNAFKGKNLYIFNENDARAWNLTYSDDVNITVNNSEANVPIVWQKPNSSTYTAAFKNININVKSGNATNKIGKEASTGIFTAESVQLISAYNSTVTDFVVSMEKLGITNYNYINVSAENVSVDFFKDEFGNLIQGQFTVENTAADTIYLVNKASNQTIMLQSGSSVIDLNGKGYGEWKILTEEESGVKTDNYKDYINYRNGLENAKQKLQAGEDLNVVYFGGSVTKGTGLATEPDDLRDVSSWRALVGSWLEEQFPNVTINNINEAIGETGTFLGNYRFRRDIIDKNPDIFFIEYSINDLYDSISYTRASIQYETIVRTVKEQLPNCDIVTILVTDVDRASDAAEGKLHTQAQAHEDIAAQYGIPTIHVGRALADHLVDNLSWTGEREDADGVWATYFTNSDNQIDKVHPNEEGYAYYFKVIREFLNNTLNHDAEVTSVNIPEEIVNKYLFSSEMTFIDPLDESIIKSGTSDNIDCVGLTGSYTTRIQFNTTNNGSAYITVPFNGTEIVMIASTVDSKGNTYQLKVDTGEFEEKTFTGDNPTVLVKNLNAGEHTVTFKMEAGKALHINGFYVRNAEKVTNRLDVRDLVYFEENKTDTTTKNHRDYDFSNTIDDTDFKLLRKILLNNSSDYETVDTTYQAPDYYVQSIGYEAMNSDYHSGGSGVTPENPAATVADLVASLNEKNIYCATDTVNVNIMQRDDWNDSGSQTVGGTNKAIPYHSMTSWSRGDTKGSNQHTLLSAHKYTLSVKAYRENPNDTSTVYLAYTDRLGKNSLMHLAGPTEFSDITLVDMRKGLNGVNANGCNVTFADSVKFGSTETDYNSSGTWNGEVKDGNPSQFLTYRSTSKITKTNSINYDINNALCPGNFYILSNYGSSVASTVKEINLTVNNEKAALPVKFGTGKNSVTSTVDNVNINLKAGTINIARSKDSDTGEFKGTVNVTDLQILTHNNIVCDISEITEIVTNSYIIRNTSSYTDAISFVKDSSGDVIVGQFEIKVPEGNFVLIKQNGEEILRTNNDTVINLDKGTYELAVIDTFYNDGETITVYKDCSIDLSQVSHTEQENKVFLGWQKADDSYPEVVKNYTTGDVLTAQYADFNYSNFVINDISLNNENESVTLSMGYNDPADINNIPNTETSEKGVLWVETDSAGGREMRLDQKIVTEWNTGVFTVKTELDFAPNNVTGNSAPITLAEDDYNTFYTAKGYIKYTDMNGIDGIIYSDEETTSAYKVAKESTDTNDLYSNIIASVEAEINTFLAGVTEALNGDRYDVTSSGDSLSRNTNTYDVFYTLSNTGSTATKYKRSIHLFDIGAKENIELGWLSDSHFNYISETDIEKNLATALASYTHRGWMRDGTSITKGIAQINFMSKRYKKTIVTGDTMDYISFGLLGVFKALIADKSINNSILMATGNHDFAELSGSISGVQTKLQLAEKYEMLKKSWSHDVEYYEEILKTSDGQDNVMIVVLDNGYLSGYYPDGTAEKLQASIDNAREKEIPILIFQHVAMTTYNQAETAVYKATNDTSLGTASSNNGTLDMSKYNDKDQDIQNIIRKNYDVIKGIFCGHEHENYYTEVTALNNDGEIESGKYIPQFILTTATNNIFGEIVVEADTNTDN